MASLYQLGSNIIIFIIANGTPSLFFTGEELILLIEAPAEVEGTRLEQATLLAANGDPIQTLNLTAATNTSYVSLFMPPVTSFQLQIIGEDSEGNQIIRITTTGVQVSDIDLKLGTPQIKKYL